jgi:hypothetical protein
MDELLTNYAKESRLTFAVSDVNENDYSKRLPRTNLRFGIDGVPDFHYYRQGATSPIRFDRTKYEKNKENLILFIEENAR